MKKTAKSHSEIDTGCANNQKAYSILRLPLLIVKKVGRDPLVAVCRGREQVLRGRGLDLHTHEQPAMAKRSVATRKTSDLALRL